MAVTKFESYDSVNSRFQFASEKVECNMLFQAFLLHVNSVLFTAPETVNSSPLDNEQYYFSKTSLEEYFTRVIASWLERLVFCFFLVASLVWMYSLKFKREHNFYDGTMQGIILSYLTRFDFLSVISSHTIFPPSMNIFANWII